MVSAILFTSLIFRVFFDVFAFGIAGAAQKLSVAPALDGHWFAAQFANFVGCRRFLRRHFAVFACLLDVFAFGITGAAQKLSVAATFDSHRFAAQFANFIGGRCFLRDDFTVLIAGCVHRGFTFRVAGAGQEFSETSFLDQHGFSAFIAFAVGCLIFHVFDHSIFVMSEIFCIFTFGIVGAAEETAVFPPFDDHGGIAFFTNQIG